MQQYYYYVQPPCECSDTPEVYITGKKYFDKFKMISDQCTSVYDDDVKSDGSPAHARNAAGDDSKYVDNDFIAFIDVLEEKFGFRGIMESAWDATDLDGLVKFLEEHPNFETHEEYRDFCYP